MADLDLAALLCSRICHDLVGPIGAITNGLEILAEEDDPEMRRQALTLIGDSAAQAARRLQFIRLAFGATGGLESEVDMEHAAKITRTFFQGSKVALDWNITAATLPNPVAKLALSLTLLGGECLPRGGALVVVSEGKPTTGIVVTARGDGARLPDEYREGLTGADDGLTPRGAPAYYASLLAQMAGATLTSEVTDGEVRLSTALDSRG